jgi:hypothetical protein
MSHVFSQKKSGQSELSRRSLCLKRQSLCPKGSVILDEIRNGTYPQGSRNGKHRFTVGCLARTTVIRATELVGRSALCLINEFCRCILQPTFQVSPTMIPLRSDVPGDLGDILNSSSVYSHAATPHKLTLPRACNKKNSRAIFQPCTDGQ